MIESLLPASVVAVESFTDDTADSLFPEEAALVANAVEPRRREFATTRRCAREALAKLGAPPAPLLRDPKGAPQWPSGFIGSITHCAGYRAAAVTRADALTALGIDAEPNLPLPDEGVLDLVTLPEERRHLTSLASHHPEVQWDRLLFSAKETVYKVWYPLTHRWLDFHDATLTLHPATSTFTARILVPSPFPTLTGTWLCGEGLLVTAATITSSHSTSTHTPTPGPVTSS
ncbi:4'-phosphopantetheinyl transferase superfamily protein [Streptomyces sp. NPDC045431]|uniref:4'-phosphopantetheinyl transferase family protein n=1 Tax=Streptomyces sp. NPDC045431 TaxID=3155613 RepID=UPI0033F9B101